MTATAGAPPASLSDYAGTIRAEVARRKVRQRTLAEALSISQQQMSARLNGRVPFTVEQLIKVADVLGMPAAELLP